MIIPLMTKLSWPRIFYKNFFTGNFLKTFIKSLLFDYEVNNVNGTYQILFKGQLSALGNFPFRLHKSK